MQHFVVGLTPQASTSAALVTVVDENGNVTGIASEESLRAVLAELRDLRSMVGAALSQPVLT